MHARPEICEILIAQKLRPWVMIAKYPAIHPGCPPARARATSIACVPAILISLPN
jgi:hypothetical protein